MGKSETTDEWQLATFQNTRESLTADMLLNLTVSGALYLQYLTTSANKELYK